MDRPTVTICGLGPGSDGHLTVETLAAIERHPVRFLRTTRHPTAARVAGATSFDRLYDTADRFDDVYAGIVEEVVAEAVARGPVLYAVPGSPFVLESSVRRLRADDRVDVEIVPALSFLDVAWARLGIDPVDDGVRLVDGHRFATEAAGERGPLLVAHVHAPWVLSAIKLAVDAGPEQRAVVCQGLGTDDERIIDVAWPDLDRVVEPDHLTSLFIPSLAEPVGFELVRTVELVHRLRQECPWDQEQDHRSLRPYLLEETYEALEAIDLVTGAATGHDQVVEADPAAFAELEEELGDLWFQILFHAELATEAGQFGIAEVARTMHDKLVGRHPHVFGDVEVETPDQVARNWEELKRVEKAERTSALDGIPTALPALALAAKVLQRAARAGHPAREIPGSEEVARLLAADSDEGTVGRLLLAVAARSAEIGVDAEAALRTAVAGAERRFRHLERDGWPTDTWVLG